MQCTLCPRNCKADRRAGQTGYCAMTEEIKVARIGLHRWEEPCISGENGSGTVFFSGCPLRCVFCQNRKIALGNAGRTITIEELAQAFLNLQSQGAHNINLVTPTHYVPQIVQALKLAKEQGLVIPVVYNTGSYETPETLRLLEGLVDIYLPDCKYYDRELAARYSNAPNYYETAIAAIAEMVRQVGEAVFDGEMMTRGVIVRHMILPGCTKDSKEIIRRLHERFGDMIYISIMNQYTPMPDLEGFPELTRKVTKREYERVVDYAISIEVENGFIQEGDTAKESFIPDFSWGEDKES